jgi:hypothetical protein
VWPSGVARDTNSLAIEPLAPARLSMMTVWPSSGPSFWAMVRAIASLPPPAAVGTTMVIGLARKGRLGECRRGGAERRGGSQRRRGEQVLHRLVSFWGFENT